MPSCPLATFSIAVFKYVTVLNEHLTLGVSQASEVETAEVKRTTVATMKQPLQENLAPDNKDISERMKKLLEIKEEMEREIQMKKERLEKIKTARERRQKLREVKQSLRKRERVPKKSPPVTPTKPISYDSVKREETVQRESKPKVDTKTNQSGNFTNIEVLARSNRLPRTKENSTTTAVLPCKAVIQTLRSLRVCLLFTR